MGCPSEPFLAIEPFEFAEAKGPGLGQVPGILQPDEAGLVHQGLVGRSFLPDLVAAHLADGLHQVAHDVELVEDREHEFPLRCLDSLVTSKYLTKLILLNTPDLSTRTDP